MHKLQRFLILILLIKSGKMSSKLKSRKIYKHTTSYYRRVKYYKENGFQNVNSVVINEIKKSSIIMETNVSSNLSNHNHQISGVHTQASVNILSPSNTSDHSIIIAPKEDRLASFSSSAITRYFCLNNI